MSQFKKKLVFLRGYTRLRGSREAVTGAKSTCSGEYEPCFQLPSFLQAYAGNRLKTCLAVNDFAKWNIPSGQLAKSSTPNNNTNELINIQRPLPSSSKRRLRHGRPRQRAQLAGGQHQEEGEGGEERQQWSHSSGTCFHILTPHLPLLIITSLEDHYMLQL